MFALQHEEKVHVLLVPFFGSLVQEAAKYENIWQDQS